MLALLKRLLRRAVAACYAVTGCAWFRLGSMLRARRAFERVLDLQGDAFVAYVHLGRIACLQGDFVGWRREMEHARRADPERFQRLSHPFDLFEPPPSSGTPFAEAGERATWRSPRGPAAGRRGPARTIGLSAGRGELMASASQRRQEREARGRPGLDDCGSDSERTRFRQLGPISAGEVATADVDEICRRLQQT